MYALAAVFTRTSTAWADCAPNAAILAGTTYPIANVPNAAGSLASISRRVVVLFAGCADKYEVHTATNKNAIGHIAEARE